MQDAFEIAAIIILIFSSVIGFGFGVHEAMTEGKCTNTRIVHYHPARVLACELFQERFK